MGYNRSKSKTSRRVKRAKTNKRNNKRKQTFRKSRRVNRGGKVPQTRMQEDDAPQTRMQEDDEKPHVEKRMREDDGNSHVEKRTREDDAPQPNSLEAKARQNNENNNYDPDSAARKAHEKMKDMEIHEKILFNMNGKNFKDGKPRYRDAEDPTIGKIVDQNEQLENTKRQNEFEVAMDWESDDLITIGGKKKRATRRK